MRKHAKKQKDSHKDPHSWTKVHKSHKDEDREKPREERKKKRPLETREQDMGTRRGPWRQGSCGPREPL